MSEPHPILELMDINKAYGTVPILKDVNLSVLDGEFISILGPSGSGKSTILRIIAGLASPTSGDLLFEGRSITNVPTNRRPFNTVFQDYALFPHMNVAENIGFALRVAGVSRADSAERVGRVADMVRLGPMMDRLPSQLSGGQRQRVALARALVARPRLVLLDEPLAALDVELRKQMRSFLKSIQREVKTTFLFVTHDQEEALEMADRICVVDRGKILQIGTPQELYYTPQTEFVARFLGDNNLIAGRVASATEEGISIDSEIGKIQCSVGADCLRRIGSKVTVAIRPEEILLESPETIAAGYENRFNASIQSVEFAGAHVIAVLRLDSAREKTLRVRLRCPEGVVPVSEGQAVTVAWKTGASRLVSA